MKPKSDIVKQLERAHIHLVEKALIGWLEETLGRVVSDEEVLKNGRWANFAMTPLSVFEKDGWKFSQYYIWANEFVVAVGFPDPEDLLCLRFVELRKNEWPTALRLFVEQMNDGREKEDSA